MDRNDRSISVWDAVVLLFFRTLWIALIFLVYVQNPEYYMDLPHATDPDFSRLACTGAYAAVIACRQGFWLLFLATGSFPPPIAAVIGVMVPVKACLLLLFLGGMSLETAREVQPLQRKAFTDNPRHTGQPYTSGLFALALHINYFGDASAFTGFVLLASNSWAGAAAALALEALVSLRGSISEISHHMATKYGPRLAAYCAATPYRLIPFLI